MVLLLVSLLKERAAVEPLRRQVCLRAAIVVHLVRVRVRVSGQDQGQGQAQG